MEAQGAKRNPPAGTVDRASAPLEVYLLGRFEVVRGDAPIPAQSWRRRRPADLLKLIALTPGRSLARDKAIDLLWPDKDPASGANNLHRALYDLRQILGGRWVDLERGVVHMRPDVWVDVDAFEEAVATGAAAGLDGAVALYRGDLSPEDLESPWLQPRRVALRRAFAVSAFPLAREAAGRSEHATAIPLLRRVLEVEPTNEEAHQLLMRLLAESGRRADALRQYDACELAMRSSGHVAPSFETRALRDAVQRGEVGPSQVRPPFDGYRRAAQRLLGLSKPLPLRGRTSTLLLLESMVEQGSGALVLLGERGVGKTRLAVEGARIAQERGALVLAGLADAAGPAPFALFADAWADYQRAHGLSDGDPFTALIVSECSPDEQKLRLIEAVQRSLASIAGMRPVYLLCEDIHLADESSMNLFHCLARQAKASRLMLVATCREEAIRAGAPVHMLLSHLDCERLGRGIRVQRLTLDGTREQVADILGTPPTEALASRVYRITDGSPFYTEEVARAFRESGHLSVPDDPLEAVRSRIARLGSKVEALLTAAAVAGRRFDFEIVRPVAGLTAHEALRALDLCLEARIVDEDAAGYRFHHSLVRDAVYDSLLAPRRVELHRAVADSIEARAAASGGAPDLSEQLAWHRRAAGQPAAAARHFLAAGHRAASRAGLSEALVFFAEALELMDQGETPVAEQLELLEAMGRVQMALADLAGLDRTFEAAAALAQQARWPDQRARARRLQALGLVAGGHLDAAETRLEEAHAEVGGGDEAAEILHLRALVRWHAGDARQAAELADRAIAEASGAGELDVAARAREAAALARSTAGLDAVPPDGAAARATSDLPFEVDLVLWARALAGGNRPFGELEAEAAVFGERARRRGDTRALAASRAIEGAVALEAGRWDVGEVALRDAAALYGRLGCGLGEVFALDRLGVLLTARGRSEQAMSVLGAAVLAAERAALRRHSLTQVHSTLARNRLAAGAIYAAEDSLREASETAARHGSCAICDTLLRPEAVRVALARGRIEQADAEAEALEMLATRRGDRALAAIARVARARVLAACGGADEAIALLGQAREAFQAMGAAYEATRCLVIQARALEGAGPSRATEAQRLAREAEAALEALGASAADS